MTRLFFGADDGQALVVVGAAMFVLLGALILTVDWGYGFATRRAMQNEADGAVLAAARLVATSYSGQSPVFSPTTQEDAWCAARAVAAADSPGQPTATNEHLAISFSADGVAFTAPITDVPDCSHIPNPTGIADDTRYVRVRASAIYDSSLGIVTHHLEKELQERLADAGVQVLNARISHLAYAPEIAQAMLQRQQAGAIIAARQLIVQGAVSIVEMALEQLSKNHVVELDEERKANMVSNLLVVLCGERGTQPVVNAGTIYR